MTLQNVPVILQSFGPGGLTWFQWLGLAGIIVVSFLFGRLDARLVRAVLGRLVRRTESTWDDIIVDRLAGPISAALALALAAALVPLLDLPPDASRVAYRIV